MIDADGSGLTNLTETPGVIEGRPVWSPDGERIAFDSDRDAPGGRGQIYVMNADGTDVKRLTASPSGDDRGATWSPDGRRIAFSRLLPREDDPSVGERDIYVVGVDGGSPRNLTGTPMFDGLIPSSPAFSPDGGQIAFLAYREGAQDPVVWVVDADGSDPAALKGARSVPFSRPTWAPDGERIAFAGRNRDGRGIYVMNANGTDQTRLLSDPARDVSPAWAPE